MFIHLSIWFSFYLYFTYYLKKHTTSKLNVCLNSNTSQQAMSSCYSWSIVADKGCLRGENRYLELHYLFSFCIIILFCILIAIIIIIIIEVVFLCCNSVYIVFFATACWVKNNSQRGGFLWRKHIRSFPHPFFNCWNSVWKCRLQRKLTKWKL